MTRARRGPVRAAAENAVRGLIASDPVTYHRVSPPNPAGTVHKVFSPTTQGVAGFVALTPKRGKVDVGGLVARPGASGVVRGALAKADAAHPTKTQTLDAFDGHLPKIYAKHGFTETHRLPFDPQYAPAHWDEGSMGRPDVVFMQRPAAQQPMFNLTRSQRGTSPLAVRKRHEEMHLGIAAARPDLAGGR